MSKKGKEIALIKANLEHASALLKLHAQMGELDRFIKGVNEATLEYSRQMIVNSILSTNDNHFNDDGTLKLKLVDDTDSFIVGPNLADNANH